MVGMASSYVPNFYGSSLPDTFALALQKKLPALTTAQARHLVAPTLAEESQLSGDSLPSINYHQRRNYAAYCSHRKRKHHKHRTSSTKRSRRKTSL
jgi:hypothetical protein